jgi:hypothetical protein
MATTVTCMQLFIFTIHSHEFNNKVSLFKAPTSKRQPNVDSRRFQMKVSVYVNEF